ncbi:MAG: VOC family protein [Alphaproteobacteria bacterium]
MSIKDGHRPGQLGVTLLVKDVRATARFYSHVFGAREQHCDTLPAGPDQPGVVPVAMDMRIGEIPLTICANHANPAPATGQAAIFLTLYVDDVDATMSRALAAGAAAIDGMPPAAERGERTARFADPAGHVWLIRTAKDTAQAELPGRLEALRAQRRPMPPRR